VQHALRAFTPRDVRAVRTAAETFRQNPKLDTATVITELGVGEALVSMLEGKGVPSVVERTLIRPPSSRLGTITDAERHGVIAASPVLGLYDEVLDRESAHELLRKRAERAAREIDEREDTARREAEEDPSGSIPDDLLGTGAHPRSRRRASSRRRTDSTGTRYSGLVLVPT